MKNIVKRITYRLGRDVGEAEDLRDSKGRPIDSRYADEAISDALRRTDVWPSGDIRRTETLAKLALWRKP